MKSNMDNDRLRLAKEALESGSYDKDTIEYIFPELKESEDEKARKEITNLVMQPSWKTESEFHRRKELVAWLEKKSEQKPVVPKFRVGDKVKKGYLTYTVEDIGEDSYKLQAYSKDGDKGCTEFLTIGYEKDYELVESKPIEWSKDDNRMYNQVIEIIEEAERIIQVKDGFKDSKIWLKSLQGRYVSQPKQEWSEEDKEMLEKVIANIECPPCTTANYKPIREMVDWLNFLKERYAWKPSDEQINALDSALRYSQVSYNSFKPLNSLFYDLKKLKGECL